MTETPGTGLPRYLTTDEAAAVLRVSREWVSDQCRRGALPAKRVGHAWRIAEPDLAEFMRPDNRPPSPPQWLRITARQRREWSRRSGL